MPKYVVSSVTQAVVLEGKSHEYDGGVTVVRNTGKGDYFLSCCGFSALEKFDYCYGFKGWNDKAEYLACIYRALYDKGTVMYVLTSDQVKQSALHHALVELGAFEITSFPNRYYGRNMIHVFQFAVRNIAGRYCDRYGNAYASEEDIVPADVIPEQHEVGQDTTNVNYDGCFARLPTNS